MRIILIFLMFKMSLFSSTLKVGENAPSFILDDQDGKQHQLFSIELLMVLGRAENPDSQKVDLGWASVRQKC